MWPFNSSIPPLVEPTWEDEANRIKNKAKIYLNNPILLLISGGGVGLTAFLIYRRFLRRIPTADFITPTTLEKRSKIKGKVTSVGDADGFRLYHTPFPSWLRWVPKDLKAQTISVRLAGVDAPELAHFGKSAQPFGAEAMAYLKKLVENRKVTLRLLRKDQYGRVVSAVYVRRFPWLWKTSVSMAMLKAGLAVVYTQSGAVYPSEGKRALEAAEAVAKSKKIGMWSQSHYESPAEYKKRTATAELHV